MGIQENFLEERRLEVPAINPLHFYYPSFTGDAALLEATSFRPCRFLVVRLGYRIGLVRARGLRFSPLALALYHSDI